MKSGDTVRVIGTNCIHRGQTGTLVSKSYGNVCWVTVGEQSFMLHRNEIEVISAENKTEKE